MAKVAAIIGRRHRIILFMRPYLRPLGTALLLALATTAARASSPGFDLAGPPIEVRVIRGGKQLPISEVPNLQPGDRLWLHADLPENQSVRYLLIAAFLRGTTNPPPEDWFTRVETWTREEREEGAETAHRRQHLVARRALHEGPDPVDRRVAGGEVDAGAGIGRPGAPVRSRGAHGP